MAFEDRCTLERVTCCCPWCAAAHVCRIHDVLFVNAKSIRFALTGVANPNVPQSRHPRATKRAIDCAMRDMVWKWGLTNMSFVPRCDRRTCCRCRRATCSTESLMGLHRRGKDYRGFNLAALLEKHAPDVDHHRTSRTMKA